MKVEEDRGVKTKASEDMVGGRRGLLGGERVE